MGREDLVVGVAGDADHARHDDLVPDQLQVGPGVDGEPSSGR